MVLEVLVLAQTKTRVHNLAKQIGVTSKAIVEKCSAEGLPIANHMTVLTAGQIETISEWFSEGPHTTTVEVAERVDLKKVRRPRKAKKPVEESAAAEGDAAVGDAPAIDETDAVAAVAPTEVTTEPPSLAPAATNAEMAATADGPVAASAAPGAAAAPGTIAPRPDAPPSVAPTPPESPAAAPLPEQPARPAAAASAAKPAPAVKPPSRPAGPQNVPEPAKLSGPRVIRIEKPDLLPAPRPAPRAPRGPGMGGPGGGGGGGQSPGYAGPSDGAGVAAGRKRGTRSRAVEEDEKKKARARINPRRRDSDVGEKLREWRERDVIEMRERLKEATGRSHRATETTRKRGGGGGGGTRQQVSTGRPVHAEITEPIVLKEFCFATGIAMAQMLPKLSAQGILPNLNATIDAETAELIALDFGVELTTHKALSPLDLLRQERESLERKNIALRPPIVTILGHVDHGKTSLLDRIRKTKVAAGEAGGITQHIGAYHVKVGDRQVVFLDTPGHAAFTEMRARGANVTDVVVLVVAADDGIMPQTVEAINHARAAKVPIVVALNKIDLPGIDLNNVYGRLSEYELTPQEWGGETDVIKTSATTGQGIDELLEHLAAMSDLMELKADTKVPAWGTVVEAQKKEGVGSVARVIVREGTLKRGDVVVCGPGFGKVRMMTSDSGQRMERAGPSIPVELSGLSEIPAAGDDLFVVDSVQAAKSIAEDMQRQRRDAELTAISAKPTDLASLMASVGGDDIPELNVIIKADVQGSVDVLRTSLNKIQTDEVKLAILHAGVGAVTDSDVSLAAASRAIIIAFNVVAESAAERKAGESKVEIRSYRVIYDVENDVRKALGGLLAPTETMESRGQAEVREVFNISKVGRIAGCFVRDGVIARNHTVRVVRDGVPVKEGAGLASLKRFKDDAREVRSGLECGIRVEGFDDVKPGDIIESYEVIRTAREL
jgi:translation initiation factor IF-2